MKDIRDQLQTPSERILSPTGVVSFNVEEDLEGIFIIKKPKELISYLVIFKIEDQGHSEKISVILPSPNPESLRIYDFLRKNKTVSTFEISQITELDFLSDPNLANAATSIWQSMKDGI